MNIHNLQMLRVSRFDMSADPAKVTAQELADLIQDQLLALPIRGGERIFEAQIARDLGVNRPLVREACRILGAEGLLSYTHNKGFSISKLTPESVLHLIEFRIILERAAFAAVASTADRTKIVECMEVAYDDLVHACEVDNPASQVSTDLAFHRVVIEQTKNPWIIDSYMRLITQFRYATRLMSRSLNEFQVQPETHLVLIDCVKAGDPVWAKEEIKKHIEIFLPNILQHIENQ